MFALTQISQKLPEFFHGQTRIPNDSALPRRHRKPCFQETSYRAKVWYA